MCLSVCYHSHSRKDRHTDLIFWCRSSGRISRSSEKVKVIGQRSTGKKSWIWWRGDDWPEAILVEFHSEGDTDRELHSGWNQWYIRPHIWMVGLRHRVSSKRMLFTPHVCDVSGLIVLTSSVCLCVTTLTAKRTDIQTCNLGQGQGHRSRSRGQKHFHGHLYICNVCRRMMPKNRLTNTTARNTATWGVPKADAFFLVLLCRKLNMNLCTVRRFPLTEW